MGPRQWSPSVRRAKCLMQKSVKVEWEAHEQADRMSSFSMLPTKTCEATSPGIVLGQHLPLPCLVDIVDQFYDPTRDPVL